MFFFGCPRPSAVSGKLLRMPGLRGTQKSLDRIRDTCPLRPNREALYSPVTRYRATNTAYFYAVL